MDDARREFMTTVEVAERAGTTRQYIANLCQDGTLDAVKAGRDWLISRDSALAWIYSERKVGRPRKHDPSDEA